jgi:magnesium transporter
VLGEHSLPELALPAEVAHYAARAVIVDCAHYKEGERKDDVPLSLPEAAERLDEPGFVWIGLRDPSEQEMAEVAAHFDLPALAVEDAHEMHQRPKLEDYGDDWFLVLKAARYDDEREEVDFGEIQIFLGPSYAVVVRQGAVEDLRGARKRLEETADLLQEGPISVVWAVLDKVVDDYEPVVDGIAGDIEEVERAIFERGDDQTQRIYFLRRELARFYRVLHPLLGALHPLEGDAMQEVSKEMRQYFRDVADHLRRLDEEVMVQRDLLDGALNANLGAISLRQNEIVRKVSGWAAIGIVPTLIASIYGMNFDHMPELRWGLGYPAALLLMALLSFTVWRFLRRWNWL